MGGVTCRGLCFSVPARVHTWPFVSPSSSSIPLPFFFPRPSPTQTQAYGFSRQKPATPTTLATPGTPEAHRPTPSERTASKDMSTQQTPQKLFIHMSGAPSSSKSMIARLLRHSIGGVVIDHDVLRSNMLDLKIPFEEAAKLAYGLQWKLARNLMEQGLSIIIDSTCNFQEVLN